MLRVTANRRRIVELGRSRGRHRISPEKHFAVDRLYQVNQQGVSFVVLLGTKDRCARPGQPPFAWRERNNWFAGLPIAYNGNTGSPTCSFSIAALNRRSGEFMALKEQLDKPTAEPKKSEGSLLEAVVRDNVLFDLGEPKGLHRVQVKCVWGDNYRVNVFVGPDVASFKVVHSYFLQADSNGKILASTPTIARMY